MGKWGTAFDIMRDVVYGLLPYMDLFEQTTLAFIFGRTRLYGKDWELIPLRHFMCGVWSPKRGCIIPRIRISETKLIEALKRLEAKGIIEVERRSARTNRYRIRERWQIDLGDVLSGTLRQEDLVRKSVKEMQRNQSRLSPEETEILVSWTSLLAAYDALENKSSPPPRETTTPELRQRDTPAVEERNKKPISLKLHNLQPASLKTRRMPFVIKPLPLRKQRS